jgi:hypothetical protein
MRHFTIILVVLNLIIVGFSYTLFTLYPFWTKIGSIFCPRMAKGGSLLVFYIGDILVDKNTLCNGCFLTGLSVLFRVFKLYEQCLISCHVYGHKFLRRCP